MSLGLAVETLNGLLTLIKNKDNIKNVKDINKLYESYNKERKIPLVINGSITKLLSKFIIEPIIIVDDTLRHEEVIDNVIKLNSNIFISYFTQAFDLMVKVNGMNHNTVINLMGTDKVNMDGIINKISKEDYVADLLDNKSFGLSIEGIPDDYDYEVILKRKELEDGINSKKKIKEKNRDLINDFRNKRTELGNDYDIPSFLQKNINIEIVLTTNGVKHIIAIPMIVKFNILFAKPKDIIGIIKPMSDDKKFSARLDEYRSGAIGLSDLIFGNDLIREYKKGKLNDESKLIDIINRRSLSAATKRISDGAIGFENFYNMYIISNNTRTMIESIIKGKINKVKYKEKALEALHGLLLTLVDTDYERATVYTKDIGSVSDISFKALSKGKGSGGDADLANIFKALVNNQAPTF